jgi:predicted AlkP superfamily pyrophosphatase or phosphodiesterase
MKKLLVIDAAALAFDPQIERLAFRPMRSVFPAVTCTAQASFRTAAAPARHGMVANGLYYRQLHRPMFWEQSADLVEGPRIWDAFRRRGGTVGLLFWQQSLGEQADVILSPAPIHKHHGGMIQDCYSQPAGLYERLCQTVGGRFNLMHYWGPLASAKAGDWIASATAAVMKEPQAAPGLLLTYLPTLDYDFQRWGPTHAKSAAAKAKLAQQLALLTQAARAAGYEVLIFGDYTIAAVTGGAVFPNRALREAGLMSIRVVGGREYPDFHTSRAFAVADHEVSHVYVRDGADVAKAAAVLRELPGVAEVFDRAAQAGLGLDHANSGELVLVAEEGKWLAYPWWTDKGQAPDFAAHVDIHNKPGYDPCELFFGWPPMSVSQDTRRIRGSHGRAGTGRETVWASTIEFSRPPETLVDLAAAVRDWLDAG